MRFIPSGTYQAYSNIGFRKQADLLNALYDYNIEFMPDLRLAQRQCDKFQGIGFATANTGESQATRTSNGGAFVVYGLRDGSVTLQMVLNKLPECQGAQFFARVL